MSKNKKEVFLGGTCNDSQWREDLIPKLKIDYFNPVVKGEWKPSDQEKEIEKRKTCDYVLYVITPKMEGIYSICEATADSILRPEKTLFSYLIENDDKDFNKDQIKSLEAMCKMLKENGALVFHDLDSIATYLNKQK